MRSSKKTLPNAIRKARGEKFELEVWAEDQHRVGLKPVLRKILAPKSERPIVRINPRYEWLWLLTSANLLGIVYSQNVLES